MIRPSSNEHAPSGRPTWMYSVPELNDTQDYMQSVKTNGLRVCESEAKFRNTAMCEEAIYDICNRIMSDNNHDFSTQLGYPQKSASFFCGANYLTTVQNPSQCVSLKRPIGKPSGNKLGAAGPPF